MTFFGKIVALVVCVVVLLGAVITWQVHVHKGRQQVEEMREIRASAERGDPKAEAKLGDLYHYGRGVPQDYTEALRWYHKGADQEDSKAQYEIGYMYDMGQGNPQDFDQAVFWYRKAADQGYSKAQCGLASMYYDGRGVQQDRAEAARLYRQAAERGHGRAQYDLGYMYENGQGLQRDHIEAKRWYRMAADQGDGHALGVVGGKMSVLGGVVLILQFFAGIWLSLHFAIAGRSSPGPAKSTRGLRRKLIVATGVLGAFSAAFNWYGYGTHRIRYLSYGLDAFNSLRWLIYSVLVALLLYIVLSRKVPATPTHK